MTEDKATHRVILALREYAIGEDRGLGSFGAQATKPIPIESLLIRIERLMAIHGWKVNATETEMETDEIEPPKPTGVTIMRKRGPGGRFVGRAKE